MVNKEAVNELVNALETLVAVGEEESIILAQGRADASRMRERFHEKLGEGDPSFLQSEFTPAQKSKISNRHTRLMQRESALLDALHALMQLSRADETQSKAEKIFDCLRAMRITDLGEDPEEIGKEIPFHTSAEASPKEVLKQGMIGSLSGIEDFLQRKGQQMERAHALLQEAMAEARSLL